MQATASFASTLHNHKNKDQKKERHQTGKSYASNVMLLESLLSYHVVIIHKSRQNCPETDIFTARGDNQSQLHQINAAYWKLNLKCLCCGV